MKSVTAARLRESAKLHPLARSGLNRWEQIVRAACWERPQDVKQSFRSADFVRVGSGRQVVVFNVGGIQFRLVVAVHYDRQKVFVLRFYPHHEYSRNDWKLEL
ncbi:MAG TPA: type II toxin-antitoxin system HigB family toxin [Chthoniobacterales bacterium]